MDLVQFRVVYGIGDSAEYRTFQTFTLAAQFAAEWRSVGWAKVYRNETLTGA